MRILVGILLILAFASSAFAFDSNNPGVAAGITGGNCPGGQFVTGTNSSGLPTCGTPAGTFPGGNPPQITGFSAANVGEAETLGGDANLTRTGANAYSITVTRLNGLAPGGSCSANQFVTSINASGVPTCSALPAGSSVPAGNAPQIVGFSAANTPESETVSGGAGNCAFSRTGANTYAMACPSYAPLASPTFTGTVTMPDSAAWSSTGVTNVKVTNLLTNPDGSTWHVDGVQPASSGVYTVFRPYAGTANNILQLTGNNVDINALSIQDTAAGGHNWRFHAGATGGTNPGGFDLYDDTTTVPPMTISSGDVVNFRNNLQINGAAFSSANIADYSAGNWTPVLQFGGASVGITYTQQSGTYVKIGRMITYEFAIVLSSKGTSTGSAALVGLPYPCLGGISPGGTVGYYANFFSVTAPPCLYTGGASNSIGIQNGTAGGGTIQLMSDANFSANSNIQGNLSCETS